MFEQYLESVETNDRYAIVKVGEAQKLRGALRLLPKARKHGKNAIEIPNNQFDPSMAAFYATEQPFERILWQDGILKYPRSAIKNESALIVVEHVWVFRQRLTEDYIKGLKNEH